MKVKSAMPTHKDEEQRQWDSRCVYIMVLLSHVIGLAISTYIPSNAVEQGALGYLICQFIVFLVLGVPFFYIELIIGQFTQRDCIDIWKIRPCVSHMGYIVVFCQIIHLINNHTIICFIVHYFLISFESPLPYYQCGSWARRECNLIKYNFTVNQLCTNEPDPPPLCRNIYLSFPENQYWRYYVMRQGDEGFLNLAWRVCLASGMVCILMYLSNFKRKRSLRWTLRVFTLYPIITLTAFTLGSLVQKGVVMKFEEAMDSDFTLFSERMRLSNIIYNMLGCLNIGSGIGVTLSSSAQFRTPCYSSCVLVIFITAITAIVAICSTALMICPYTFNLSISTQSFMDMHMSLLFEKTPKLIEEYTNKKLWLILVFSCHSVMGLSENVVSMFCLLELVATRYPTLARYPGLLSLGANLLLFLVTVPLLGKFGMKMLATVFRRYIGKFMLFLTIMEFVVFILWYGLNKFSEDVHFMLGIKPTNYMKASWILSSVVLMYVLIQESYHHSKSMGDMDVTHCVGLAVVAGAFGFSVLGIVVKLAVAAARKRFREAIALNPKWGPRSELLKRSRGMFSAQAMTKEYMYRQYHLQAGITARERRANIRNLDPSSEQF